MRQEVEEDDGAQAVADERNGPSEVLVARHEQRVHPVGSRYVQYAYKFT